MERGRDLVVVEDLSPFDSLFKLLHQSPSTPSSRLEEIFDDLVFWRAVLMDPPQDLVGADDDDSLEKLASCIAQIGSVISSLDLKQTNNQQIIDLIDSVVTSWGFEKILRQAGMVEALEAAKEIYDCRPDPSDFDFPSIDQLGFINQLVENVDQLMKAKANSVGPLKYWGLQLQKKLNLLCSRLMEIPESRREEADLKHLIRSITGLAYQAEYVIDSFLVGDIPIWYCMFRLYDTILSELEHKAKRVKIESGDIQTFVSSILCMKGEFNIIPIVNNTEMSKKLDELFNHPDVVGGFDARTRSLVGSYQETKNEVFLQLLCNASYLRASAYFEKEFGSDKIKNSLEKVLVGVKKKRRSKITEIWLKEKVHKLLVSGGYFIILEDVRDMDALNDIRSILPHEHYGSTILLTTPSPELALQCHRYEFFNDDFRRKTSTSQSDKPKTDDDVIGFKVEMERILELLVGGQTKLHIISIIGMAGQGKTTLANKLYRDASVVNYFYTLSWCCVSQIYKKRELLLELLGEIVQYANTVHDKSDEELAHMLFKKLKGRRFLIVLDDIWTIDAWNDLKRCFPNDNNGSRIIFTTRIQELASQTKSDSILQPLFPLSDDESWELLRNRVFQKKSCPPELLRVGRQISKKCRGLPLSVVLIGGILAKMEKKLDVWGHIAKTLSSHILGDVEAHGKGAIELSFNHLPNSLKACFLYFGAFLEDKEILVWKLVQLWIAEGFIKHKNLKSLEDVAMDYLMDLVGRSLITVAQEKSTGGVKSCRVHDLLREFCLTKSREENFLHQINGYDEYFLSSNKNLDYGMDPNCFCSSTTITYDIYRLSIYSKRNHFTMLKPSGPFVRSLLFFASSDMCPSYSYDISFIFYNFKFLRILDIEEINIGNSLKEIDILVLLRYLAFQSDVDSIPSSIANLQNLETFLFKGMGNKVVKIPNSIWDMDRLRHLHVSGYVSFDLEPHRIESSSILDNLQTFSTPCLAYGDDMVKILGLLRGIRKLKCIFLDSWNVAIDCNRFPELEFLNQLVSLKVFYHGKGSYPCRFSFPSNLNKLTLSNFHLPWNEISQLAALSSLEVLKLLNNAFEGETWEMEDEVFPRLKFLKLKTLNVVKWVAFDDHFPSLERLILHKCEQLEEIPPVIGDTNTLQMIEVMWCSSSTATSAKKIQDDQLEYSKIINVHIHPSTWDSESSL